MTVVGAAPTTARGGARAPGASRGRRRLWVGVLLLCAAGLALRVVGLSEQPYDFHSVRQLYDVLMARGFWLTLGGDVPAGTQDAVRAAASPVIEPPVVQLLAAALYLLVGHESVVAVRVVLCVAWAGAGVLVARSLQPSARTAAPVLAAVAAWELVPFGVLASRSFQPDGLVVVCLAWLVAVLVRPDPGTRRTARLGPVLPAALAIGLKLTAVFFVVPLCLALACHRRGPRALVDPRTWGTVLLAASPGAAFYAGGVATGALAGQSGHRVLPHLLLDPWFWSRWWDMTVATVGPLALVVVGAGLLVARGALRAALVGLVTGYVAFGLVFTYHYATHSYYHLPLVLVLAVSVGSVALAFERAVAHRSLGVPAVALALVLVVPVLDVVMDPDVRSLWAPPERAWTAGVRAAEDAGEQLDHSSSVVFLSADGGLVFETYGYLAGAAWPTGADLAKEAVDGSRAQSAPERMEALREQMHPTWFVVSDPEELSAQPDLAAYLAQFPVDARGDGWVAYRLG